MRNEKNNNYDILIVDDEPLIRESLYEILRIDGYNAHMAESGEVAMEIIRRQKIDIVITDMKLPKMSGLAVLHEIKECSADTEVILVTGYGSVESAVEAMKTGAYDYITKPINDNEIKIVIGKIIEKKEILKENKNLRQMMAQAKPSCFCDMIGASEKMQKVYHVIDSVASSNATILVTGESGTGKGMVARAIHRTDRNRCDKPFVEVSCGALSETLLESELFGHVKGAFTSAIKDKEGRFEYAKGGTVFLDEIDAFSPRLQVKLLKVLQDGIFERVGDNVPRKTDARIIVATNRNLPELVKNSEFREDLYYRINVISIHLPALRERKEDIESLVEYFMQKCSKNNKKKVSVIAPEVKEMFLAYSWPGNIRELENAIEGAVIMAKTGIINKSDVPNAAKFEHPASSTDTSGRSLKAAMRKPEREVILAALEDAGWNRNQAAAALGINRTTLYNKMKKYDIDFNRGR